MALLAALLPLLLAGGVGGSGSSAEAATFLDASGCAFGTPATTFGAVLAGTSAVTAQDCALTFGSDVATADLRTYQADGLGSAMAAMPGGTLDPGWGTAGQATINLGAAAWAYDGLTQPDGRVVAAGERCSGSCQFAVARFTPSGAPDPTFGTAGSTTTDFPSGANDDTADAVALQADGKLVLAGYSNTGGGTVEDFALARYLPNGQLDTSFGTGGLVTTTITTARDIIRDLVVQPDGKLVVTGTAADESKSVVARYLANGQLDRTFGVDGIFLRDFVGGWEAPTAVALTPDGHVVAGGSWQVSAADDDTLVFRLTAAGALDTTTFAAPNGYVRIAQHTNVDPWWDSQGLAVQPDGRILVGVGARTSSSGPFDLGVARITAAGALDPTWGTGGTVRYDLGNDEKVEDLALQADGRVVVSGRSTIGANTYPFVARLSSAGALDASFGTSGTWLGTSAINVSQDHVVVGADGAYTTFAGTSGGNIVLSRFGASQLPDYALGTSDFATGATGMFGACLRTVTGTGALAGWTPTATCTTTNGPSWNAVPTDPATATNAQLTVARATTASAAGVTANLRFGARIGMSTPAGSYVAPLTIEVVAAALVPPANTVAPLISGTALRDHVLTANPGTWTGSSGVTLRYRWLRCDTAGANCLAIDGATGQTYVLTQSEVGTTVRVQVTGVNGEGQAVATSAQTATVTSSATLMYLTGFESGVAPTTAGGGLASTVVGAPTVDAAVKRNGNYSLKVSGAGDNYMNALSPVPSKVGVLRFAFRAATLPTSDTILGQVSPNGAPYGHIHLLPSGRLYVEVDNGATAGTASYGPTITAGGWHVVDLRGDLTTSTFLLDWRIDGVAQPQAQRGGLTAANLDMLQVGNETCASGCATVNFDDVAFSNTPADYPLGDGKVTSYVPDTAPVLGGAAFQDQASAALTAAAWGLVDDDPMGSTVDYVKQVGGTASSFAQVTLGNTAETLPARGVRGLVAYNSGAGGANNARSKVIRNGETEATATTYLNLSTSGATQKYAGQMIVPPAAGWTSTEVNALQVSFGYWNQAGAQPYFESLRLEAEYPLPVTAPASSVVPVVTPSAVLQPGDVLYGTTGTFTGTAPLTLAYQWQRCTPGCSAVVGAVGASYTLQLADVGATLKLVVTAANGSGSATGTSLPTSTVTSGIASPTNVVAPAIVGTLVQGSTLTAGVGSWLGSPSSYAYQWLACNAAGGACVPVGSAATYVPGVLDTDHELQVRVLATNAGGTTGALSPRTGLVKAVAPTLTFLTGFETGTVGTGSDGLWDSFTGDPSITTTKVRSGNYALDTAHTFPWDEAAVAHSWAGGTTLVQRFAIRVETPTSGSLDPVTETHLDPGLDDWGRISLNPANQLVADFYQPTSPFSFAAVTGPTLVPGRWYVVEQYLDATSSTQWEQRWRVDGVDQPTTYLANPGGVGNIDDTHWGSVYGFLSGAWQLDDISVSATLADYPLGDGTVVGLRPDSPGSASTGTASFAHDDGTAVSTTTFARLDDAPFGGIADDLRQVTAGGTSHVDLGVQDLNTPIAARGVRGVLGYHALGSPADNAIAKVWRSGDTDAAAPQVASGDLSNTAFSARGAMVGAPAAGWTAAQLDALEWRLGYSTSVASQPAFDAALLEVDLPVPPGQTTGGLPEAAVPTLLTAPTTSGTTTSGELLTATTGSWGNSPFGYQYQWRRCDTAGASCVDIGGQTQATYWLGRVDAGSTIRVAVTAMNGSGNDVATSAATAVVAAAAAKSILYTTGFEGLAAPSDANALNDTAGFGLWGAYVGYAAQITSDTTTVRNGSGSLRLDRPAGAACSGYGPPAAPCANDPATEAAVGQGIPGTGKVLVARFAVRLSAAPDPGSDLTLVELDDGGATHGAMIGVGNQGGYPHFRTKLTENGAWVDGAPFQPDRWYVVDARWDTSTASNWKLDWRIDGVPQPSGAYTGSATSPTIGIFWNEIVYYRGSQAMTAWYDDESVSTTAADFPIADGSVLGESVVASGTHVNPTNFQYCTGGACTSPPNVPASPESTTFPLVDDWPIAVATWVRQGTASAASWLEYKVDTLPATVTVPPEAVRFIYARVTGCATADTGEYNDGTNANLFTSAANAATQKYSAVTKTSPPSGGAWTIAKFNALKLRWGKAAGTCSKLADIGSEVDLPR